jgi:formylglycine-generating enzyme required for sulfatase activity
MKQNYKISLCALLLVGATGIMTAGAQGSGNKPTLAVFVVGMQTDALGNDLAQQIAVKLNSDSRYNVLPSATDPVKTKLAELRKQDASGIDRNALAEWGRTNGVSTICLVVDDIKGNDHMFYARLIDAKDSKQSRKGHYIRTGVGSGDIARVSLMLARQLDEPKRKRNASASTYPAELNIEMVFVEGGTFTIGCVPERDGSCYSVKDNTPAHSVTITRNFWIGKYEITRAQWTTVMAGTDLANQGYWTHDDQLPVEMVSWNDVQEFLTQLNSKTGKNYRLPTNAEWEYAARGGRMSNSYRYSGSNNPDDVACYVDNSSGKLHLVGERKPNELGIYDMSGSLWEWCSDWYGTYPSVAETDPTGPGSGTERINRGGCYYNPTDLIPIAGRDDDPPAYRSKGVGFRVVLPAQ